MGAVRMKETLHISQFFCKFADGISIAGHAIMPDKASPVRKERDRTMNSIQDSYIPFTIGKQKKIALIAHDSKKPAMVAWVEKHADILKGHFLCGTGTTARLIADRTGLPVKAFNSGPLGGDQQIGARIVEGTIDFMIFFWDPLEAQPHDPDVKALLRIAAVYDIPVANNRATADFLLASSLMNEEYERLVINYNQVIKSRIDCLKGEA
jgi:methylglyoxal synthase